MNEANTETPVEKKKPAKKKTPRPEQLAGESKRTFRLRLLKWYLDSNPEPAKTIDVVIGFSKEIDPAPCKEVLVRDLKVLEARGEVKAYEYDDDKRYTYWQSQ